MTTENGLGGEFTFAGTGVTVNRMGYGAMQLTGPMVYGEPRDRKEAVAVLRRALELGINHIDTSDYYGPHIANQIIKEAIHPYPEGLVIVTKLGAKRAADKSWPRALSAEDLTEGVHDNLRSLGLEALDMVNLRVGGIEGPVEESIAEPLGVLAKLKEQGLIKQIGLSNMSPEQVAEAQPSADIVCVQNHYNVAHRGDDKFIADLAAREIAYVPFFLLGGFRPLQSQTLERIAAEVGAAKLQSARAWLAQRSPNILLLRGNSSVAHLEENIAAANLKLSPETVAELDGIAGK